jgi:hypothetical protein
MLKGEYAGQIDRERERSTPGFSVISGESFAGSSFLRKFLTMAVLPVLLATAVVLIFGWGNGWATFKQMRPVSESTVLSKSLSRLVSKQVCTTYSRTP